LKVLGQGPGPKYIMGKRICRNIPMANQNRLEYKWNGFYVGVFPILEPSYWLLRNKQPIEIGSKISPANQQIGTHLRKKPFHLCSRKVWFTVGNWSKMNQSINICQYGMKTDPILEYNTWETSDATCGCKVGFLNKKTFFGISCVFLSFLE